MSALSVTIGVSAVIRRLRRLEPSLRKQIGAAVEKHATRLADAAREQASASPQLAGSIRMEIDEDAGGSEVRVYTDGSVPFARLHEYGGPIAVPEIVPKTAKVLAFAYNGRIAFASRTRAHGAYITPRPYMQPALDQVAPLFLAELKSAAETLR